MRHTAYEITLNGVTNELIFDLAEAQRILAEKREANPYGYYELYKVEW